MATTSSVRSKVLPQPLYVRKIPLTGHFEQVTETLRTQIDVEAQVGIQVDWNISPAVAALAGTGCERIYRNRGRSRVHVAPLKHLGRGLWAWLGYREEWAHDLRVAGRFMFRSASMTIHFGWKHDDYKPQMFRAEWAGWASWDGSDFGYQAGNAGHPHRQFDAPESLSEPAATERAEMLREILEVGEPEDVQDFVPPTSDARDIVSHQKLGRIHFASAAAWWKSPPHCEHAHGPERIRDLQVWQRQSLSYLSAELNRLQIA